MITDSIRTRINVEVMKKFRCSPLFIWEELSKGFTNRKYLIMQEDRTPLAICKTYSENSVIESGLRFEREKQALELFEGILAPQIIWYTKPNILVYDYVPGTELHLLKTDKNLKEPLFSSINLIHRVTKQKRLPLKSDVIKFNNQLYSTYVSSPLSYPKNLIEDLENAITSMEDVLDQNEDSLTYIHGDLVPANIIIQDEKIFFIDWEFFRPDLSTFDFKYFDYYSSAHNLGISLSESKSSLSLFYSNLVRVLDDLWWFGFKKQQHG